jgi:hypothetical protein
VGVCTHVALELVHQYKSLKKRLIGGEGGIRSLGALPHQRFRPDPKPSNHQIHSKPEYQVQNRYSGIRRRTAARAQGRWISSTRVASRSSGFRPSSRFAREGCCQEARASRPRRPASARIRRLSSHAQLSCRWIPQHCATLREGSRKATASGKTLSGVILRATLRLVPVWLHGAWALMQPPGRP